MTRRKSWRNITLSIQSKPPHTAKCAKLMSLHNNDDVDDDDKALAAFTIIIIGIALNSQSAIFRASQLLVEQTIS